MSNRDREIVEEYKRIFSLSTFSSPHLSLLDGEWYLFEKEGERTFIAYIDEQGCIDGDCRNEMSYFITVLEYTATPLLIHKVDTHYTR